MDADTGLTPVGSGTGHILKPAAAARDPESSNEFNGTRIASVGAFEVSKELIAICGGEFHRAGLHAVHAGLGVGIEGALSQVGCLAFGR